MVFESCLGLLEHVWFSRHQNKAYRFTIFGNKCFFGEVLFFNVLFIFIYEVYRRQLSDSSPRRHLQNKISTRSASVWSHRWRHISSERSRHMMPAGRVSSRADQVSPALAGRQLDRRLYPVQWISTQPRTLADRCVQAGPRWMSSGHWTTPLTTHTNTRRIGLEITVTMSAWITKYTTEC